MLSFRAGAARSNSTYARRSARPRKIRTASSVALALPSKCGELAAECTHMLSGEQARNRTCACGAKVLWSSSRMPAGSGQCSCTQQARSARGQSSGRAHHRLEDVERKRFHREDDVWPAFHRGSQHVQEACLTCGARGRVRSQRARGEDGQGRYGCAWCLSEACCAHQKLARRGRRPP